LPPLPSSGILILPKPKPKEETKVLTLEKLLSTVNKLDDIERLLQKIANSNSEILKEIKSLGRFAKKK
jgi:uncharacterized protein (UPF0335 family)